MTVYAKARAIKSPTLICSACQQEVYRCDACDNYIPEGDEIQCCDGFHYHLDCEIHVKEG